MEPLFLAGSVRRTGGRSWQSCTASRRHGHQEGREVMRAPSRPLSPQGWGRDAVAAGVRLRVAVGMDALVVPAGPCSALGGSVCAGGEGPVWERLAQEARSILVPCAWPGDAHDAVSALWDIGHEVCIAGGAALDL